MSIKSGNTRQPGVPLLSTKQDFSLAIQETEKEKAYADSRNTTGISSQRPDKTTIEQEKKIPLTQDKFHLPLQAVQKHML